MKTLDSEVFRYRFLTEVRFGPGIRHNINDYLKESESSKFALLYDKNAFDNSPVIAKFIQSIQDCVNVYLVEMPSGEPNIDKLDIIRKKCKEAQCNGAIGVGGGSTMDMAKGLAAILPNDGPTREYQGLDKLEKPGVSCLLVPTLFGSGAEVTPSAVMINYETKKKGGINGRYVFPKLAIIDPELAINTPKHILGATALDALVHSIEGFTSRCATRLSSLFSREAAHIIIPALDQLTKDTSSLKAIEELAYGALLAITGLMHSEAGVSGAASYPLGVYYKVPHGIGGGILLPKAIEFNIKAGFNGYQELIPNATSSNEAAHKLIDIINTFIDAFQIPSLSKFNIGNDEITFISKKVFEFKQILNFNPIQIKSEEEIQSILIKAL